MEQIIKLTGRIAKVFPANSGTSQSTGNNWMSQEYLLEFFTWSGATNPNRIVFRVFGEDRIKKFNLKELEENVTVVLRIDAHEYDGRWFNEVNATNVIREGAQQSTAQPAPQDGGTSAAPSAPQPGTGTAPQSQGGETDDLPF